MSVAGGVASQPGPGHGDTVNGVPLLGAQVEEAKIHSWKIRLEFGEHGIECAILTNFCKGGIGLGRVAQADRAAAPESRGAPARNRFNHGGVSDNMLPMVGTGKSFVVFLDPVWLEHDPVA